MRIIIPILFFIIKTSLSAQLLFHLKGDSLITFNYSGGDEFNSNTLDENAWTKGMGWTRVLMSQEVAFTDKMIKLGNGLLNLETTREDSTYTLTQWEVDSSMIKKEGLVLVDNKFRTKYVSGSIISKNKYHYGLYELRFKVDKGRGVWPAFWFFGGNKNEEIDAFELKCEKNKYIHVDTHCPHGCDGGYKNRLGISANWGGWMPVSRFLHDGYNIMLLEWKAGEVIWYINGYPLAYFRGAFANPMNLYINSNVAADGRAFGPGPNATTEWPNKFLVDYVRAWRRQNGERPVLKPNAAVNVANADASLYSTEPTKKSGLMYWRRKLSANQGMISLNLRPDNKIIVCVLGKMNKDGLKVTLKAQSATFEIKDFIHESEFQVSPADTQLELTIKTKNKTYSQTISLLR